MYCICCKKNNVFPLSTIESTIDEEKILWEQIDLEDINHKMISGGIINTIEAGYGSKHDTDTFIIAICDECISKNLQDSTLLLRNSLSLDQIEKSKQFYRRRKNLDDLTDQL